MQLTRTLIALAALCLVAAAASRCPEDCTQFKMEQPPKPEEPGINTGEAVAKIFDGLFSFLRAKNFGEMANNFGYMAGGLFTGIVGASQAREQSKWAEYKLQASFKQTQDYLACVMESQSSNVIYDVNQRMDADRIDAFNAAVQAVVDYATDNCGAHNCLNVSDVEPSRRNAATGLRDASCVAPYAPAPGSDCSNVVWDPAAPRLCRGMDKTGGQYDGVCGEDGQCYHSRVGFLGTIEAYSQLKSVFLSHPAINGFNAFANLKNPNAVVAYAKGTAVYMAVLQELYFLGSPSGEESTMRSFAGRAADWLQSRVDFHTNFNVSMKTVMDASNLDGEPVSVRASCRADDVMERWWGCTHLDGGVSSSKQYCLINAGQLKNADKLCAADCSTADQQSQLKMRAGLYSMATVNGALTAGANRLSDKNKKLFTNGGVYKTIEALRAMAAMNPLMPEGSFAMYQRVFTPKLACTPVLRGAQAEGAVKPLGTWEAPDNLRKGSVVLRGTVVGGEAMQRVGSQQAAPKAVAAAPTTTPKAAAAGPKSAPRRMLM